MEPTTPPTAAAYFITIGAFERLLPEEIEDATRSCLWTSQGAPCTFADFYEAGFWVRDFTETRCVRGNQSFWVLTKKDRSEQWVVTPEEHDHMTTAFGPSLYSDQYDGYLHEGEFRPSGPSDFNMVRVAGSVVNAVGWTAIRECATTFAHPLRGTADPTLAVRFAGDLPAVRVFRSDRGLLLLAVCPGQSAIRVLLLQEEPIYRQ